MSAWNNLLGGIVSGATEIFVARENAKTNARQYENDALRASVSQAETARQRELALVSQFQQYMNENNQTIVKITNFLLVTVAAVLMGVIFYNVTKSRRG